MTDEKRPAPPRSHGAAGLRNYSFKLPPWLIARLDKMARDQGRSRNAQVRLELTGIAEAHHTAKREARKRTKAAARA